MAKKISRMNRQEIEEALAEGGFYIDPDQLDYVIKIIKHAARRGALLWSPGRIISTLHNDPLTLFSE